MVIFKKIEDWLKEEEEEKDDLLTSVASPQVKIERALSDSIQNTLISCVEFS